MQIREAVDADHDQIIDLTLRRCRQLTPPLVTGVVRDPTTTLDRVMLVAHAGADLAGMGIQFRLPGTPPTQCTRFVIVDAPYLRTGLGSRLFAALGDRLPPGVTDLAGTADDEDTQTLAVLEHWGYQRLQRSITSELRLDTLPDLVLPEDVSIEASNGLTFADEAAVEAMLDASQTNPERAYNGPMTLAQLRSLGAGSSGDRPLGLVLRVDGAPAAISYGILGGDLVQVLYTGVDPALRGRGLARLVKEALHHVARDAGAALAITNNEERNAGIRRINDELGYRRTSGVVWVRLPLD